MIEYPKMLYKEGGIFKIVDKFYSSTIVKDEDEEKKKIKDGWSVAGGKPVKKRKVRLKSENSEEGE